MEGHDLSNGWVERETKKGFGAKAGETGGVMHASCITCRTWPYGQLLSEREAEGLSVPKMDRPGHQDHHRKLVVPSSAGTNVGTPATLTPVAKQTKRGIHLPPHSSRCLPRPCYFMPLGPTRPLLGRKHTCLVPLTSDSKSAGFAIITLPVCVKQTGATRNTRRAAS